MTGGVRAENTNELLLRVIAGAIDAGAPALLFVLDDAQWLDSSSWALAELLTRQARVLLVVSKRPWDGEQPPREASWLAEGAVPGAQHVRLEGLPRDDIAALVAERLGAERISDEVADFIARRAEGNPFFSEELAYSLRDTGVVAVAGGLCQVVPEAGSLEGLDLPDTLESVVMGRVDRLPPPVQLTLKVASVAGRSFSLDLLRAVHPVVADRAELPAHLETVVRLDLVLETTDLDPTYTFKHVAIRDVAYNLLLFAQRRQLHAAVARWFEQAIDDDPVQRHALLAHHWAQAGVCDRAAENLGRAGEHALRTGAYPEAVEFLRDALAKGTDAGWVRRAGWERRLGDAEMGRGRILEARRHLRRAGPWPGGRSRRRRWASCSAWSPSSPSRPWPASASGASCSTPGPRRSRTRRRRPASSAWSRPTTSPTTPSPCCTPAWPGSTWPSGPGRRPTCPGLRDRVAGQQRGARAPAGPPLRPAGHRDRRGRRPAGPHRLHQPARRHPRRRCRALGRGRGPRPPRPGDLRGAGRPAPGRRRRGRAVPDRLPAGPAGTGRRGVRRAPPPRRAPRQREAPGVGPGRPVARAAAQGLRRRGAAHAPGGPRAPRPHHDRAGRGPAHRGDARPRAAPPGRRRAGRPGRRGGLAGRRRAPLAHRRRRPPVVLGLADAALALWERADEPAAPDIARRALRDLRKLGHMFPIARPRAMVARGTCLWLRGRQRRAQRWWERGLREAQRMAMPYEAARAHYELGRHRPAGDPERARHLEQAAAIFAELGTDDDLARTRGVLATAA